MQTAAAVKFELTIDSRDFRRSTDFDFCFSHREKKIKTKYQKNDLKKNFENSEHCHRNALFKKRVRAGVGSLVEIRTVPGVGRGFYAQHKTLPAAFILIMLSRLFSGSLSIDLSLKNGFVCFTYIIQNNYWDRFAENVLVGWTAFSSTEKWKLLTWRIFKMFPQKPEEIPTSS